MRFGWFLTFFGAAALLAPVGPAWANEPPPPAERLAAEGWSILNGDSVFEPFCDRPAQAQEKFKRAIEHDPDHASAYRGWGRAGEDLARCPFGGPLTWADTVGLTEPPPRAAPPVDLPAQVIIDAAYKYRRAADLAPDDPLAWADWGRSLLSLAALEPDTASRLEMVELALEKYERAEALAADQAELRLVQARGLLTVLGVEDDPAAWPGLWEQTQRAYYGYIDLSPDAPPRDGQVCPKLAAWSVFGREVSQAARDFREPEKTRLLLTAVIEAMRLLVVAKPDYDLSLDVNSLSRACLDLMAITPGEEEWLGLLSQAGDLAARMIELDPANPVNDFVLWNWRRSAEAETDPFRRSALIAKALTVVELLEARELAAEAKKEAPPPAPKKAARSSAKGKGKSKGQAPAAKAEPVPAPAALDIRPVSGHASRFMMVLAAIMERGPRREELLARADRGFEAAAARARGEAASRLRQIWAQELMNLAALETDPRVVGGLIARADEQFRLSLETTAAPGLALISWASSLESTTVEVTPDSGSGMETASSDNRPGVEGAEVSAGKAHESTGAGASAGSASESTDATASTGKQAESTDAAAADPAGPEAAPTENKTAEIAANEQPAGATDTADSAPPVKAAAPEVAPKDNENKPSDRSPAGYKEQPSDRSPTEYQFFEEAVEKYQVAAALPGGERAFDYLGAMYFRRAQSEKNPVRAEELWLKALESFRRAALPGAEEGFKTELAFRLGLIYATLAAQGEPAARACLKDSGHSCLGAALRVHREVYAALPEDINRSISAGGPVIRPDLTPALRPRTDPTRLGPTLNSARVLTGDATARRRQALTRAASDGFFQILLAVDLNPPPRQRRNAPPPPPERRARLLGPDRALLAALYRLAAGYRQMDQEYKTIYLRRAESL